MSSIQDDRGFNQGFKPSKALSIRLERRSVRMISEMTISSETKILELGCGTGELSFFLAKKTGAQVIGTDLCSQFIDLARASYELPNLKFQKFKLAAASLNEKTEKYNYIVGNGILHHVVNDLDQILYNLRARLLPGGRLLFWEPNIFNPYVFFIFKIPELRKIAKLEPDEMAFGRAFIRKKLKAAGFSRCKIDYSDFLLPNTPEPLISSFITVGNVLEKIPGMDHLAQSLFISAGA